jgi:threonylcarbamoyladenosine tRNA methylthiotransferase MtaB
LTGIHIGQWGLDFEDKKSLLDLLVQIDKTNIKRFRLGSLNPLEITDDMIDFLSKTEKFCPHFHLSIQSMCDETLKRMNRHYSVSQTLDLIENLNKSFSLPFLGCDIIAGFVGETETEFNTTVENIKKSRLSKIHTFPYSIRKGTLAETFNNHISDNEKTVRANVIKKISEEKYYNFLNKNIGTFQEVLIEKKSDKKTGLLKGMTKNYIELLINSKDESLKNTLQYVQICKKENKIFGEITNPLIV